MATYKRLLPGLFPNSRYIVRVRSMNRVGVYSQWSEALDFVTPSDQSTPRAPTDLVVDFHTTDLLFEWTPPEFNTDGTHIQDFDHYEVVLFANGQDVSYETKIPFFAFSLGQNETAFGTPQSVIDISIRAVDISGNTSEPLTGIAENDAPLKPLEITGVASFQTIQLSFTPHPDDRDISKYIVEKSPTELGNFTEIGRSSSDGYLDQVGPEVQQLFYRYKVVDYFGQESPYSDVFSITSESLTSMDSTPPIPVEDFTIIGSGVEPSTHRAYVDVEWTPNNTDPDLANYEVRIVRSSDSRMWSYIQSPNASSYRIENLETDTEYQLSMYAHDYSGNRSSISTVHTYTTPLDNSAPDVPTNLTAVSAFRTITIRWNTVLDVQLSHYEVYASQTPDFDPDGATPLEPIFEGNANRLMFEAGDNETWHFLVRAVNHNGAKSLFSLEATATTDDGLSFVEEGGPNGASFNVDENGNIWVGDSDFASAPFRVSNVGAMQARNAVITGDLMSQGSTIIDTPGFDVDNEGNITAVTGTIGNVTINEDGLSGGTIEGSTFKIQNAGQVLFEGSGTMEWDPAAMGGIIVSNNGFIRNAAYEADQTTGFNLDASGLIINEGSISAQALQIGVSSVNLVQNGSMGPEGDESAVAANWALVGPADATVVQGGQRLFHNVSQELVATGSGNIIMTQNIYRQAELPFEAGEVVSASFWVKQTTGVARIADLRIADSVGTTLYDANNVSTTLDTWVRVIAIFKLASAQPYLTLQLRMLNVVSGDTFYVDGAKLERSDFPTDFTPAPLDIPNNYIQSAHISSLTADRLTSGQIASAEIEVAGSGRIYSYDFTDELLNAGWEISADGAKFYNGAIEIIAAGQGNVDTGYIAIDGSSMRLQYGTAGALSTQFKVDKTGVYIGGADSNTADIYFDGDHTRFQSSASGYSFTIDTSPPDGKILSLRDGADNENFYLTTAGKAYLMGGLVDGSLLTANSITANHIDVLALSVGQYIEGNYNAVTEEGWIIDGAGNAEFNNVLVRGTVQSSDVISSTVTSSTITGSVIKGSTIYTSETGQAVVMGIFNGQGRLQFYTGNGSEVSAGRLVGTNSNSKYGLELFGPFASGHGASRIVAWGGNGSPDTGDLWPYSIGLYPYNQSPYTYNSGGQIHSYGNHWIWGQTVITGGSSSSPAITFNGDTNTGIYRSTSDEMSFSAAGTRRFAISPYGVNAIGVGIISGGYLYTNGSTSGMQVRSHDLKDPSWTGSSSNTGAQYLLWRSSDGVAYTFTSSEIGKTSIRDLSEEYAVEMINDLRPRMWQDDEGGHTGGFVAEEVPTAIQKWRDDGDPIFYDDWQILAALVKAMQYVLSKVDDQERVGEELVAEGLRRVEMEIFRAEATSNLGSHADGGNPDKTERIAKMTERANTLIQKRNGGTS